MVPPPLPSRPLGRTDLTTTPITLGTAPLGDMPETFGFRVPEDRALATLRAAFSSAVRALDTAANYGDGRAESRIGRVLAEIGGPPADVLLATKADRDMRTGDFSGAQMKRSVEGSLLRLGLDRLPLVYIHDPEHTTFENVMQRRGPLEVLQGLRESGVIGAIGISGGPIDMLMRYVETGAFDAVETHSRFTLLNRSATPLLDLAARRGVAVVNAAVYGSGILARGPAVSTRYAYQEASAELIARARQLEAICAEHEVPLSAAALQFSLRDPRVTTTVVGMTRPQRVAETLALARQPIPEELWRRLDAIGFGMDDPEAGRWG